MTALQQQFPHDPTPVERMGPDVVRCSAITKSTGGLCPRAAQAGSEPPLCWTHGELAAGRTIPPPGPRRKPSPATGAATTEEAEAIAAELAQAEDAAGIKAVLAKVAALALAGRIQPRVAAAVAQVAGQALKALAQDHRKAMAELHKILDQHQSEAVRGWSRRRKGARA